MRLKQGFILHNIEDEYMAVATGEAARWFNGLIRNNETADFIYRMLQKDTTEEAVVRAMCERYEASEEVIKADVKELIEKIKQQDFWMSKSVIEEQLRKGFPVSAFTKGDSMEPLLYEARSHVLITPLKEELSVGELPLFKRQDGVYIIHRIIGKDEEFYYTRGDNCFSGEKVRKDAVLGVVVEIFREGKHIHVTDKKYLCYVKIWNFLYPLRKLRHLSRLLFHRIKKKKGK